MKPGYLSQFFSGVAIKRLSAVEANPSKSNQHEFNGVAELKGLFGIERQVYDAKFIYLGDNDEEPVIDSGKVTWYDARERHATRSEHRMYFPTTNVSLCAAEGDLLVIGRRPDNTVLCLIVQGESTIANQVLWLFRVDALAHHGFSVREELETEQDRLQFASNVILEQIGIPVELTDDNYLETMISRFRGEFPKTREFSKYARSTVDGVDPAHDPDAALMAWMEREEILFRTLEKHLISERLKTGFEDDVDGFLLFSLSVQNRRKSRAGLALENHLEDLFGICKVRCQRAAITEGRSQPDFLFPGQEQYRDHAFNPLHLTMLGVKSTCKDRWRQVLAEAARITRKHLFTLETSISLNQTNEMQANLLQLVVPQGLQNTYSELQRTWLLDLAGFIALVRARQENAGLA
jgi:hypothetical protein